MAAQTGIAPLALRDCAVTDPDLFDAVVEAAERWTAELELAASQVEVGWQQLRVLVHGHGGKAPPELAIPRSRSLARKQRRVSVVELAALTGRELTRAEP